MPRNSEAWANQGGANQATPHRAERSRNLNVKPSGGGGDITVHLPLPLGHTRFYSFFHFVIVMMRPQLSKSAARAAKYARPKVSRGFASSASRRAEVELTVGKSRFHASRELG